MPVLHVVDHGQRVPGEDVRDPDEPFPDLISDPRFGAVERGERL